MTGRVGVVFDVTSNANLYASYSRAVQPTTQLVDLDGSRQLFSLVPGTQFETGVKGSALGHRLDGTFAYFAIDKRDLLITTLVDNVSTNQQVGRQTSNGVEASIVARPTMTLSIAADYAITRANFADFIEIVNGQNVSRNGNTPTNVPHVVWNITPSQRVGPLDLSATIRQVGARWGDTANTRRVGSYTTVDAQIGYRFGEGTRVRIRGRNLADKIYTPSVSATSGRLEAPRSFDVTVTKEF
jgi:iron complex outermembrane receptor protein